MKKRLPFLVMAALGVLLWQAGFFFFATERTVVFRLPVPYGEVREVELQVWEGEALLGRSVLPAPRGLTSEPSLEVALAPGPHRAVATATLGGGPRTFRVEFDPGRDETVLIDVKKP